MRNPGYATDCVRSWGTGSYHASGSLRCGFRSIAPEAYMCKGVPFRTYDGRGSKEIPYVTLASPSCRSWRAPIGCMGGLGTRACIPVDAEDYPRAGSVVLSLALPSHLGGVDAAPSRASARPRRSSSSRVYRRGPPLKPRGLGRCKRCSHGMGQVRQLALVSQDHRPMAERNRRNFTSPHGRK